MMSIFEVYETKENRRSPKLEFRDECMKILKDAEKNDEEWLAVNQEAPTESQLLNILVRRTELKNPLWKKALAKGLGYASVNEMMGNESN